jgi:GH35 family endo-1,4-beta-xylanase
MKKLLTGGICFLLIFAGILLMGCKNEPGGDTEIKVAFQTLTADGSTTTTTTKLTLKFNKDISGLVAADVSLNANSTGANKGALTRVGVGVYELALSGVTASGNVTLTVAKTDFTITGSPKSVNIFYNSFGGGNGGSTGEGKTLKMTIGAKENLTPRITNFVIYGRTLTWSSNTNSVATVNSSGIVTAAGFTNGGTSTASSAATGTATITVRADGAAPNTDTFTINTTMESQIDMMNLPPLKDQFADYFLLGNITRSSGDISGGAISNTRLTRHYNVLTAENDMKPSYYGGTRSGTEVSGLTYYSSDAFVNAATVSGFKVHAHVLLWHSQNSSWITALNSSTGKETAIEAMQSYITQVVTRYKGKIYSWDVLNEVFPDGVSSSGDWKTSMRKTGDSQAPNPWFVAIGSDFVYEGFKATRLADPNAILYYNDYNMDSVGKSTMVANMVKDVNEAWKKDKQYDNRLLIEGIGMQSHHNTDVTENAIRTSLNRFRALGVKISISEIDVLCMSYSGLGGSGTGNAANSTATNTGKLNAANLYAQYFKLFLENADIIERVTFWGINDNMSWRSRGLPLPFDGPSDNSTSKAKPAYYKVISALE